MKARERRLHVTMSCAFVVLGQCGGVSAPALSVCNPCVGGDRDKRTSDGHWEACLAGNTVSSQVTRQRAKQDCFQCLPLASKQAQKCVERHSHMHTRTHADTDLVSLLPDLLNLSQSLSLTNRAAPLVAHLVFCHIPDTILPSILGLRAVANTCALTDPSSTGNCAG